jgi:hypothetical protein
MADYRTMFAGFAAAQAAAVTTAAAVSVRFAELTLREGAVLTTTLLSGRSTAENPIPRLCELYGEWLQGVAGLPRISALVFISELDRIRGPRPIPRASTDAADTQPRSQRNASEPMDHLNEAS